MASLRIVCWTGLRAVPLTQPAVRTLLKKAYRQSAHQLRWPFTSSILLRSRPSRIPRVQYQYSGRPNQSEHNQYNQYQPPPKEPFGSGSPNFIVGIAIAGCVGLFAYHKFQEKEWIQRRSKEALEWLQNYNKHFVLSLKNIREGRYYVLLTHTFAHVGFFHLLFNMVTLWGFGKMVVSLSGGLPTFVAIWAGSAVVGGIAQLAYWEKRGIPGKAVGASGAIFGLVTALSFVAPGLRVGVFWVIPTSLRTAMAITAVGSLACIREGWLPQFGHVDHLGGMAFGFFWWLVALRRVKIGRFY